MTVKDIRNTHLTPKHGAKSRADQPVYLSDKTLEKAFKNPNGTLTPLGQFVFYSRYSRFRNQQFRREYWAETTQRSTEYNINLAIAFAEEHGIDSEEFRQMHREELEALFHNQLHTKQALSGRTLWAGGTDASYDNPMSNFNCSFLVMDNWKKLGEVIHLGMVGSGIGFRILKRDVAKLELLKVRKWEIMHKEYDSIPKGYRLEESHMMTTNYTATISIGDSKEGWRQAIDLLFDVLTGKVGYGKIRKIIFNYDSVRPKGERLERFGGRAGGPETIKGMFDTFHKILTGQLVEGYPKVPAGRVKPIHVLDLVNAIGKNIVSGDVRSIAEIGLLDADDKETKAAKLDIFDQEDLNHRFVSNNSVYYERRPSDEEFDWQFQAIEFNGEPCFVNSIVASQRRPNFQGVNPCVEILLADRGLCNLTTVNMTAFVTKDNKVDMVELMKAFTIAARSGVRMTLPRLELPEWDAVQQRDRLIGISMTGWMDFVDQTNLGREDQDTLLQTLKAVVQGSAMAYCEQLGINSPLLETCVKPEGTQSQLFGGVSSGLHVAHAPYFIRRIRAATSDPIARTAFEMEGWRTSAEHSDGSQAAQIKDFLQYVSCADTSKQGNTDGLKSIIYEYQFGKLVIEFEVRLASDKTIDNLREQIRIMGAAYYDGRMVTSIVTQTAERGIVRVEILVETDDYRQVYGLSKKIVVDFPQKSPAKNTKANFGAVKQLEVYKQFLHHYTNHNPSNTITVRPEEWGEVKQWIKENWDDMLAVSFLSWFDTPYPLLPFEEVTADEVETLEEVMAPFDPDVLRLHDNGGDLGDIGDDPSCVNGCPVR